MKKLHYFFFYLIFTILCLALVHWIFIIFMNLTSVEIEGMFMGEIVNNNQMNVPAGRGGMAMGQTHYTSTIITRGLQYEYIVNDRRFESNRISNFIIFPNPVIEEDNTLKVYYNRFFNGYSVLVKLDFKYFIFNLIPQLILFAALLLIKGVYIKETDFKELIKNYFKNII